MRDDRFYRRWLHDFQSPLGALIAVADRIEDLRGEEAEVLKAVVQRLKALSMDLEAGGFGTDAGQGRLESFVPAVSSIEVLKEVIIEWRAKLQRERRITFYSDVPNLKQISVAMPSASLQCLLSNLIGNAFDSLLGKGHIRVTVKADDEFVQILVEDDGCGIPIEILPRVSEFGFTYNKRNGTGLGLWQVRGALLQVNGSLMIATSEQCGTCVSVQIPRHIECRGNVQKNKI